MADFLPDHPNAQEWLEKAKILACNSTSSGATNSQYPCEVSRVLTPNDLLGSPPFVMINHNQINAGYAITIPWGLAQASLIRLNTGQPLPPEYTKNLRQLYDNGIAPYVRTSNYTYRGPATPYTSEDLLVRYTGRDDWGQDATLQDSGWAYLDAVIGIGKLGGVANYAWLTRAGATAYPAGITGMERWMEPAIYPHTCYDGGATNDCFVSRDNSATHFFLNAMDAIDRFMTLFLIDRLRYSLTPLRTAVPTATAAPTPTPAPVPGDMTGDLRVSIDDIRYFTLQANPNVFAYSVTVAHYGQ
jgi:hypothetical protein